ncbi:hypothetical protein Cma02nite_23930 [Cellulomonas marina]|nr:hypothetical protein Cma02nite_23930 [Cellulomonas marina]
MRAVPPTPPAEPGTFPYERRRGPDGRMYQWRPHDQNATPPVFGVWALDQVLTDPPTLR